MKTPTDLSEELLPAFFPFFFFFSCLCLGAREPLPNPKAVVSPDLLSQEATSHSVQFPVLTLSPVTLNPSPQLPVWPTAPIQCFSVFLSFTKWDYFKILYKIAFSYCPKPSSQTTATALEDNSAVHWYKKLIWIISIPEKLQKTPGCVKTEYCYKLKSSIRQLHQSTETLLP